MPLSNCSSEFSTEKVVNNWFGKNVRHNVWTQEMGPVGTAHIAISPPHPGLFIAQGSAADSGNLALAIMILPTVRGGEPWCLDFRAV